MSIHNDSTGAPDPQGDTATALTFLRQHTHGWADRGWFLQIVAIEPAQNKGDKPVPEAISVSPTEIDSLAPWIEQRQGKAGLYFAVNPLKQRLGKKAKKADIAALAHYHADIDPREGEPPDAERARILADVEQFSIKPTALVNSGNGLGAFWRLGEPAPVVDGNFDELEDMNRRIAQALGADDCHNIDRVMRLPGTVNLPDWRKREKGRVAVPAVLLNQNGASYAATAFDTLPPAPPKVTAHSAAVPHGDLPPRFVELLRADDRLRKRWDGNTDGLNDTSRSVLDMSLTALLAIRGFNNVEVPAILQAYPHGKVAQDGRGDDYIRPMIAKARQARTLSRPDWTAHRLISERFTAADGTALLKHWRGDFYHWRQGAWHVMALADVEAAVYSYLEGGQCMVNRGHEAFTPNRARVGEVVAALRAITHLESHHAPPYWLDARDGDLDAQGLLVVSNGLLHLSSRTLLPHSPRLFTTTALPFAYEQHAEPPMAWLRFLHGLWPDDRESIETLCEFMGYALTADSSRQKILMIVGPKRAGKGTIARVMRALLGEANCAGPTLDSLRTNFGLQPLIGKRLAIISDARLGTRADQQVLAERLLSISGEDALTVDRKYGDHWTGQLGVRLMLLSNELPRIADTSGALASRFVVLRLIESFLGREDLGLADRLLLELPSILNWTLHGLERLRQRGQFRQPAAAQVLVQELEDLSSPIVAFLRECCVVAPGASVERGRFYQQYRLWCQNHGWQHLGTEATFGRDLYAAVPGLGTWMPRIDGIQRRFYRGVGLTESRQESGDKEFFDRVTRH